MSNRSKTVKAVLNDLHTELANVLTRAVQGVEVEQEDPETGEKIVVRVEAPAAILNVARQFLKDNGIDAQAAPGSPMGRLSEAANGNPKMPAFEDEEDNLGRPN